MLPDGLLNQTITIYNQSSYDDFGEVVVGSGTLAKARVQLQMKQRILPNNAVITIDGVAYVPLGTSVSVDDKVTYGGTDYKVLAKYPVPDGQGNTNHIKLELTKWLMT